MNIFGDVKAKLDKIINRRILVGIPQQEGLRDGEVTNAQKLWENTVGSPLKHVPARPLLEPAVEDRLDEIGATLQRGVLAGLVIGDEAMDAAYNRAGLMAQQAAVAWFDNPKNNWKPNSPYTIQKKGSDAPLIDTGEMRKAITFIIEDK